MWFSLSAAFSLSCALLSVLQHSQALVGFLLPSTICPIPKGQMALLGYPRRLQAGTLQHQGCWPPCLHSGSMWKHRAHFQVIAQLCKQFGTESKKGGEKNTNRLLLPLPTDFPKAIYKGHYMWQQWVQCADTFQNNFFARYLAAKISVKKKQANKHGAGLGSPCTGHSDAGSLTPGHWHNRKENMNILSGSWPSQPLSIQLH